MPPANSFANVLSNPIHHGNTDSSLMPSDDFSDVINDTFGGLVPTARFHENVDQGIVEAPKRHSESHQRMSETLTPQQRLGKHGREEPASHWNEDLPVPKQNLGEQGPDEYAAGQEQDDYEPEPKRRRVPQTKVHHPSPPAQAPNAQVVKKERRAKRDADLPTPRFHVDESATNASHAVQVADTQPTPPKRDSMNRSPIHLGEISQEVNAHGPDPPQAHLPGQADQQALSDIRDVRPANAWQCQSVNDALGYTREVYLEWTGEEPPITNLEDSYNVQYREMRAAFRIWWKSGANPQRSQPMPNLWRMEPWAQHNN